MTLTIDFAPQTEAWLQAQARRLGTQPAEVVRKLVDQQAMTFPATGSDDPTLALFAEWEREDADKTPEQLAVEAELWEEFEKGINTSRQAQGMRQL